ncbi:Transcriptional regulator, AraC family [Sinorhizobium alkalisoli]|nr:Transcriptional regulator, AraC family [Sinorhizobium alkalisoli]
MRHAHPHCHVLLKVEGADTQFSVRDRLVPLTDESAVLINAWEPHAYAHDQTRPKTVILALYIEPQWLGHFRPNWAASHAPDFFASNVGSITPCIRSRTRTLAEAIVQEPNSAEVHEVLLGELMIAVIERFADWRAVPNSIRDLASRPVLDFRIRKAIDRMKAAPGEIADLDRLAIDIGLSRAHFFRLFETSMGVTPRVFLNVQRLERAVAAVADGTESFAAISDQLGFSVPAHFSRFFHDHAGSSPSIFRSVTRLSAQDFETPR